MKTVLTIAGFDSSSGAGITADLMTFAAHGLFGTSCITSLTVQSTAEVRTAYPVHAETVREMLDCLHADLPAVGIKIGMLALAETVASIADFIEELKHEENAPVIVLDPVLRSSSGRELLEPDGLEALRSRLLPLVDWVTPNLDELGALTSHDVDQRADLPDTARRLQQGRPNLNVLATGGHLTPPDDYLLTAAGDSHWLPGERIDSTATHGTGCALSSALLCGLVQGRTAYEAAVGAKLYVAQAIRTAPKLGAGRGPMNHLWSVR